MSDDVQTNFESDNRRSSNPYKYNSRKNSIEESKQREGSDGG